MTHESNPPRDNTAWPSDEAFLAAFERQAIPRARWKHRDHVKVAYLYLTRLGYDLAVEQLRQGIKALNAANGVPETPTEGYHETVTIAWLRIVAATIASYGRAASADEFVAAHPQLWEPKILRLFYSRELIMSPRARREFVEPDLTGLPKAKIGGPTSA